MKNFEIGRAFQSMESRIENLEQLLGRNNGHNRSGGNSTSENATAGIDMHSKPKLWKLEKAIALPPFLTRLLGFRDELQFDVIPESKTWTCQPEPLITYVNWYAGGTDEFYRLENQSFTITRFTDPNTHQTFCSAVYESRLVASGRAKTHYFPPPAGNPAYAQPSGGYYDKSRFNITLRNAQNGPIGYYSSYEYYIESCQENKDFTHAFDFNPGLYDLVAGATWQITGAQNVDRC